MEMLQLTPKGEEELKQRTHRLDVRKRSLLVLLGNTQSLEDVLRKSVLPADDIHAELGTLIAQGFVASSKPSLRSVTPHSASPDKRPLSYAESSVKSAPPTDSADSLLNLDAIHIEEGIFLSEAKFLLTDFCVDCFGTRSEPLVEDVRACREVETFKICFKRVMAETAKQCPERIPNLITLVGEINETA